jgi:hypothetical protein
MHEGQHPRDAFGFAGAPSFAPLVHAKGGGLDPKLSQLQPDTAAFDFVAAACFLGGRI